MINSELKLTNLEHESYNSRSSKTNQLKFQKTCKPNTMDPKLDELRT